MLGTKARWRLLPVAAMLAAASCHSSPKLDDYGELPDFSLRDQDGQTVQRSQLAGKVLIANFIFTRCPTICPTFSMKMQRIGAELRDVPDIRLVSFSVDPDYDTPEILAKFAAKFSAQPPRWLFLTGDPAVIKESVTKSLQIALEERGELPSGTPDIVHGTHIVLIDGRHRIRGYYNSDDPPRLKALTRDARALAER